MTTAVVQNKTQMILDTALKMVRNMGFETVSINSLAKEVGMSKSGLFAHFNSKEKMHVMILDHAADVFTDEVLRKAFRESRGVPRLRKIIKNWTSWYKSGGGGTCPFIAASIEYDKKPGPVKELLKKHTRSLTKSLELSVQHCIEEGHFKQDTNSEQVAFEIYSLLCAGLIYHRTMEHESVAKIFNNSFEDLIKRYSS